MLEHIEYHNSMLLAKYTLPINIIFQHKVSIIAILEPKIKYNHASTTLVQNVMQCIGNRRHVYSKIVQRVIPPNMKPVST